MKPSERKCKKYCKDYPCNRTECHRKLGWKNNGDITMLSDKDSAKETTRMKWNIWYEDRVTVVN